MISLTFGEQVKIILSRKGMTIKELAEKMEERTGKKMSRQNMTQRLGRDNFQEQDMRLIADILGCSFQLSILASVEAEKALEIEEDMPTEKELTKLAAKKERRLAKEEAKEKEKQAPEEAERDITVGELVHMMEAPEKPIGEITRAESEKTEKELAQDIPEQVEQQKESSDPAAEDEMLEVQTDEREAGHSEAEQSEAQTEEQPEAQTEQMEEEKSELISDKIEVIAVRDAEEAMQTGEAAEPEAEGNKEEAPKQSSVRTQTKTEKKPVYQSSSWKKNFEPIKKREDEAENVQEGDVNPYTGHEYQTNSVRIHPKRIGYVQVYDRKTHKWTDMTEWAFLGYEERKKVTLGKDYEPPIYLD